jgi:hypothetical protein
MARAWAAEAFAMSGQPAEAAKQIKLSSDLSHTPFYRVAPLAQLFLQQRNTPEAAATLDQLQKAASNLPTSARAPVDAAVAGATALVIGDRVKDAAALVAKPITESRGIASLYWTAATMGNIFDYDAIAGMPAWVAPAHPQWEAVTWAVAAAGEPEKALAWAKSANSLEVREACLGVWAARVAHDAASAADAVSKIEAALGDVAPSGRARAWANFAYGRTTKGDTAGTVDALKKAEAALAEIPAPQPPDVPGLEAIYYSKGQARAGLPDSGPSRSAAAAAANVARVYFVSKDSKTAAERLSLAVAFAQATAPSITVTQRLVDEGRSSIEGKLDQALKLRNDSQKKFQAANEYTSQVRVLHSEAQARFELIKAILRDAASAGMTAAAWEVAQSVASASDAPRQDPLLNSDLPGFIALRAYASGDTATGQAIEAVVPKAQLIPEKIEELAYRLALAIRDKSISSLVSELKKIYEQPNFDQNRMDIIVLRISSIYSRQADVLQCLEFIRDLPDPPVREDAYWLLAASLKGKPLATLWKTVSTVQAQRRMNATERAALDRGFVAGTLQDLPKGTK